MFPELAAAFLGYNFTMFDYCKVEPNGDTVLRTIEEQAEILQQQIDEAQGGEIILLCHSMGSVIAGLVDLSGVSKVVLLAPPEKMYNKTQQWLNERPGSYVRDDGVFVLPRTDGTTSYISPAYLSSLEDKDPMELYQHIADTRPTVIVRATNDEVVGLTNVNQIKNAEHIDISSDHNFMGEARVKLIAEFESIL